MHTAVLVLAIAATGVDFGYEPAPDGGGYDYQIQLQPELIDALGRGQMIESEIPEWMTVRRFRISMGRGALVKRRDNNAPDPDSGAMRARFERVQRVATADADTSPERDAPRRFTRERTFDAEQSSDRASTGRSSASDNRKNLREHPATTRHAFADAVTPADKEGALSESESATVEQRERAITAWEANRNDRQREDDDRFADQDIERHVDKVDRDSKRSRLSDSLTASTATDPPRTTTSSLRRDGARSTLSDKKPHARELDEDSRADFRPSSELRDRDSAADVSRRGESTSRKIRDDESESRPATSTANVRAAERDGVVEGPSGGALALATLLLMLSIGANVYLGWIVSSQRLRFWDLVDRFRAVKRDDADVDMPLPPRPRPILSRSMATRRRFDASAAGLTDDATV